MSPLRARSRAPLSALLIVAASAVALPLLTVASPAGAETLVHTRFADGLTVGPSASSVTLTPVGASTTAAVAEDEADSVRYEDVWTSTDAVVRSVTGGAKVVLTLTDSAAPLAFSWDVEATVEDSTLSILTDGSVSVTSPYGFESASIAAPRVNTNYGNEVPASWEVVDSDTLRLNADHSDPAWTYPISVELDVTTSDDAPSGPLSWTCNGRTIGNAEGMAFLRSIGYDELTAEEQADVRANFCDPLSWFDGDAYELVAEADPEVATTVVAGEGDIVGAAPKGRYAKPSNKRADGTAASCPVYSQRSVFRLTRDVVDFGETGLGRRQMWIWVQRNVLGRTDAELTPVVSLKKGDVAIGLRLDVEACTNGSSFTRIVPPAGSSPDWHPYVADAGVLLGYTKPDALLRSYHAHPDTAKKEFQSFGVAKFKYSVDIGVVKLPTNITGLSDKELGVRITIYADGTWDYALSTA